MIRLTAPLACALISVPVLSACGDDPARGTLELRIYGEPFIEEGIPADAFADGWSLHFSKFLVAVSDVQVGTGRGEPAFTVPTTHVFDLAVSSGGEGHLFATSAVAGGRYDDTSFTIGPALQGTLAGNAPADDVAFMTRAGHAIHVVGSATRAGETRTFAWSFATDTTYLRCASRARVDGGSARVELTVHADHLFYDSLVSDSPSLRFDLIAGADADADGEVTRAELAAVDITGLSDYQVGNLTAVRDLDAFIAQQTATLGHIDGEGHCDTL